MSSTAVEIVDVARRFGAVQALDGVSLLVEQGEFFGLLGPNGAGKTTLFNLIAGTVRPDAGRVTFLGDDVTRLGVSERCRRASSAARMSAAEGGAIHSA